MTRAEACTEADPGRRRVAETSNDQRQFSTAKSARFFQKKIFKYFSDFSWQPQSIVVSLGPSLNRLWLLASCSPVIHRLLGAESPLVHNPSTASHAQTQIDPPPHAPRECRRPQSASSTGTEVRPRLQSESDCTLRRNRVGTPNRGDHRRLGQADLQAGK